MSTPPKEEHRLGLLQCPNAASRGWNSLVNETQEPVDGKVLEETLTHQLAATECSLLAGVDEHESTVKQSFDSNDDANDVNTTNFEPVIMPGENNDASETKPTSSIDVTVDPKINHSEATSNPAARDVLAFDLERMEDQKEDVVGVRSRKRHRADKEHLHNDTHKVNGASNDASPSVNFKKLPAETTVEQIDSLATQTNPTIQQPLTPEVDFQSYEKANSNPPLSISLEYESNCSCQHCTNFQSEQDKSADDHDGGSFCRSERGQIMTIKYHCHTQCKSISIGAISGRAKLQLLKEPDCTEDHRESIIEGGESKMQSDSCDDLLLDVFGYRLSCSSSSDIYISRAEWMNALPLSLVCSNENFRDGDTKTLRIRIKSTSDDNEINEESYYSAHPEESYQLNIHSKQLVNNIESKTERRNGITFISDPWRNTADKIVEFIFANALKGAATSQLNHNRILICGAKGTGKSTFLRYMANRMLSASLPNRSLLPNSRKQYVAILDLDSGQPELSPPGLLTLSIISKPIVSDPPMHLVSNGKGENGVVEHVVASYFFGDVTSKSDPDTYIHMANKLICKYQEFIASGGDEYKTIPLLVNTDGWVKGLGFEILSAIVGICNPAHIVQILGNTKAKMFDMTSFHSEEGTSSQLQRHVHVIQSFDDYTNPVILNCDNKRSSSDSISVLTGPLLATAADHRSHRICAYFLEGCRNMSNLKSGITGDNTPIEFHKEKGLVDPSNIIGLRLASMLPYAVPFHAIKLYPPSGLLEESVEINMWGVRADVACNDALDSLSGSIVGLCYESDINDSSKIVNCNAGNGVPILPCAGLGILRSIDLSRRIFYVLTPIDPQLLSSVTSFVGGNIGLPLECVYRGIYSDSFPYMSFGQAAANPGLGAEVMKSRNHSGRKK